jgi:AcrR family transcriptional regulator
MLESHGLRNVQALQADSTLSSGNLCMPDMREKLLAALRETARRSHPRLPSPEAVALCAGVTPALLREYLGPADNFPALLAWQPPVSVASAPLPATSQLQTAAQETRERILASAAAVFGRKGFERSTLDEVAADAGMTKGAIYWHFKSKNDLFFALLDQRFQLHTSPLKVDLAALLSGGQEPMAGMMDMFSTGMRRCVDDPAWARLYLECLSLGRNEEVRERLSAFYEQVWEVSAHFTRELQAQGLASADTDPETAAVFWTALFDGLVLAWLIKGGQLELDRLLPEIFHMLWRGIAPPAADKKTIRPNLHRTGEK